MSRCLRVFVTFLCDLMHLACYCMLTLVHCYLILPFTLYIPSLLMLPSADEDNDDVIESFWLYIFSVFPSFVYYYLDSVERKQEHETQLMLKPKPIM